MTLLAAPVPVPLTPGPGGTVLVSGTRVTLDAVVALFGGGSSPEDIVQSYPSLGLANVYAVVTYYLRNRAEVEAYLAEQGQKAAEARSRHGVDDASLKLREQLLSRTR